MHEKRKIASAKNKLDNFMRKQKHAKTDKVQEVSAQPKIQGSFKSTLEKHHKLSER